MAFKSQQHNPKEELATCQTLNLSFGTNHYVIWTGVTSFGGCVLSLQTGVRVLCLQVHTKQVGEYVTPCYD